LARSPPAPHEAARRLPTPGFEHRVAAFDQVSDSSDGGHSGWDAVGRGRPRFAAFRTIASRKFSRNLMSRSMNPLPSTTHTSPAADSQAGLIALTAPSAGNHRRVRAYPSGNRRRPTASSPRPSREEASG